MTETLYRKSWQPLAEADKSAEQVVRWTETGEDSWTFVAKWSDGEWVDTYNYVSVGRTSELEFLCLEPVEVAT